MEPARLEDWLSEFIERRERGETLAPEDFARQHPGGGPELLAALRALASTEALFPSGSPDLPARVGPYRIKGEIGRGGMGRVFEAEHPAHPGATIALKLLHVSLEHQPRALERFRREGKALERIAHPGIVRVLEAGLLDNRPFLAMEKVAGASLAELVRAARARGVAPGRAPVEALDLPGEGSALERAVRLVARLARALAAAHREGVLHRDVNPRNVLVRADGEPVVIDFGLMRASGDPTLTGSGDLLGTPQYMAPEQARGERVDERSDVFGLGTVLVELLTLAPPRAAEDTLALLRAAGSRPLPDLRRTAHGMPRELALVVARATAFFPRWRTPSCEALAADLERFLEGEPIRARPLGAFVRTLEFVQGHRRALAGLALAGLSCAVLALAWRARHEEDPHQRLARATSAVVLPWLEGDLAGARTAAARYLAEHEPAPFGEFLEALALDDLTRAAREPAARSMLEGERLRRAGRPREAMTCFATAWDLEPNYPLVVLLQGLAALEAGAPDEARGALEASAASFGSSRRLHRALAETYERLGFPADAQRALNAALALAPGDPELLASLARVRAQLETPPRAR